MIKRKLVILTGALSLYACGITNLALPTYVIDKVEKEKLESENNSLGGVKTITDWFALMPSVLDFDVDNNNSISGAEHYAYVKQVRWLFFNSPFVMDADADNSWSYVVSLAIFRSFPIHVIRGWGRFSASAVVKSIHSHQSYCM